MKTAFLTLFCIFFQLYPLTVEEICSATYTNNPELQSMREEVIAQHENFVQATAGFRPRINATGNLSKENSKAETNRSQTTVTSKDLTRSQQITLSQNLFHGFRDVAAKKKTQLDIKALWARLHEKEQNILFSAIAAYLELEAKYATVQVYEALVRSNKTSYSNATKKQQVGEETNTQVSIAHSEYMDALSRLNSAKAEFISAQAEFKRVTTLDAPEKPEQLKTLASIPTTYESIEEKSLANHPNIIAAHQDYHATKQQKKVATADLLPRLDLNISGSHNHNKRVRSARGEELADTTHSNAGSIGLQLSVPLYNGGENWSKRRQLTKTIISKRTLIENVRLSLIKQCRSTFETYHYSKISLQNAEKQVQAQKDAVHNTEQELQAGTKILFDVFQQRTQLVQAQLNFINVRKNYYTNMYLIIAVMGELTAEGMKLDVKIFNPQQDLQRLKNYF